MNGCQRRGVIGQCPKDVLMTKNVGAGIVRARIARWIKGRDKPCLDLTEARSAASLVLLHLGSFQNLVLSFGCPEIDRGE